MAVGFLGGAKDTLNLARLVTYRLRLQGTVLRSRSLEEKIDIARTFERDLDPLFRENTLEPVIDAIMPAEDVARAHERIEGNQHLGKIILTFADSP